MKDIHVFDPKMYRVENSAGDGYFVIAYSEVHAILEVVNMNRNNGLFDNPYEYRTDKVTLLTKQEMEDTTIDYNYVKDITEQESLLEVFQELTELDENKLDFYGVVGDDFVDYS